MARVLNSALLRRRRRSGGGVQIFDRDMFTRADSTTNLGSTEIGGRLWTQHDGTWGINGNQAYCSVTNISINGATADFGIADCSVSVSILGSPAGGVMLRAINDADRIEVEMNGAAQVLAAKRVGGAFTSLGTAAVSWVAGDTIKVTQVGNNFTVYYNGTQILTFSDATGATRTRHGLAINGGADPSTRLDNFLVTVP